MLAEDREKAKDALIVKDVKLQTISHFNRARRPEDRIIFSHIFTKPIFTKPDDAETQKP